MIIIKCDVCKKIIDISDHYERRYDYRLNKYEKDICDKCRVAISNNYKKRYEELEQSHKFLQEQYYKKDRECKAFKKMKKQELLSKVKLILPT